jgi:hypothetical protein
MNLLNTLNQRVQALSGSILPSLAIASAILFTGLPGYAVTFPLPTTPTTHYVSKNVSTSGDGSTWNSAWKELANINWSTIKPGDTIKIDGGPAGNSLGYATTLTVGADGIAGSPIKIESSDESGRNGQVLITAQYNGTSGYRNGIDIGDHKFITISGKAGTYPGNCPKSIRVNGFLYNGIVTGPGSESVTLNNIVIDYNGIGSASQGQSGCGLKLGGKQHTCNRLVLFDNSLNVDVYANVGGYGPTFNNCWIWNQGITSRCYYTDGVHVNNAYVGGFSWFYFNNCVMGPGLSTAITFSQKNGGLSTNNCLFINPRLTNIKKTITTFPDANYSMISVSRNTSFLTPQAYDGQGHSCLDFVEGQDSSYNSVFQGGAVNVVGTKSLGFNNFQNSTTGNTILISPNQTDLQFVNGVAGYPNNVPVGTLQTLLYPTVTALVNADFTLQSSSPAAGKGSTITSVTNLLKQ